MYPNLFGIEGFSMVAMILVGVIVASIIFFLFLKKEGVEKKSFLDLLIVVVFTVLVGIVFAILFENAYEAIKISSLGGIPHWTWAMTFYGGLIGGVLTFILLYRFYYLRHNSPIFDKILLIAPGCVAIGHGFGRIGCFLSGCCYGVETYTTLDMVFPNLEGRHLPTQLIEMTFLFLLGTMLVLFAFFKFTKYTSVIYLSCYALFRFMIEFLRGDERGQLSGLSPSQYWCIVLLIGSVVVYLLAKKYIYKQEGQIDEIPNN